MGLKAADVDEAALFGFDGRALGSSRPDRATASTAEPRRRVAGISVTLIVVTLLVVAGAVVAFVVFVLNELDRTGLPSEDRHSS